MSCNICEDDYGMCWCENDCSYNICQDCCNNLKKNECPQCKGSIQLNWFFAGKIVKEKSEEEEGFIGFIQKINTSKRRIVAHDNDINYNYITREKNGGLDIDKKNIIRYDDYLNPSYQLGVLEINKTTNLTGPFVIVNECPQHMVWESGHIKDVTNIIDTVNERNKEMIENCHVFSLEVNKDCDCFRSLVEWGIALEMGKIMILEISLNNPKIKEFYTYVSDSIKSFEKLSFYKREAILCSHPSLNMNYKQYKKHMEKIISLKKSHLGKGNKEISMTDEETSLSYAYENGDSNNDSDREDWSGYGSHVG